MTPLRRARASRDVRHEPSPLRVHLLVILTGAVALSGCDGGPAFNAWAEVTNACEGQVYVEALQGTSGELIFGSEGSNNRIEAGQTRQIDSVLLQPVGESLSLFVEETASAGFDDRAVVDVAGLGHYVNDEGYDVYEIVIEGALCPEG